ncbi:HesB/YadR/YfhF family protein [Bacillus horti]|uniref:Uncharacterized protein YneR n=1 Tax=Caldalkalibacillus horti TaxID=77523 RepID=A0ABT9VXR1_9BACI|nr:HesB/YadR/YfhF family protein [Bacillus horti]MDQ0165791.1 uncharacterized protein YneR [Bacillus horti]
MEIKVTQPALHWFQREMDVKEKDAVRFFARYGGCSTVQSGFSIGVNKESPKEIGAQDTVGDVLFFIEKNDLWYFDGKNLTVKYNQKLDEIEYVYEEQS